MSIQLLQEPVKITLEKRHVLRVSGCNRRLVERKRRDDLRTTTFDFRETSQQ